MPDRVEPPETPTGVSPTATHNSSAAILVVEDSPSLNKTVCELLRSQGYHTLSAHDGQEALELLYQRRVDLVLSDVVMPRLDGYGLLQRIRSDQRLQRLPVVFLTGYATPDDRRRAKESGVEDYLAKPLDKQDLLATVRNVLARQHHIEDAIQREIDALRSQILGLVQHEFRTPLTFVMGYAEFLQSALDNRAGIAELRHSVEAILEGSRRLHNLIESFLLLASLNDTAIDPGDLYPLDPMALWGEVVDTLHPNLTQAGLDVVFVEPSQPWVGFGLMGLVREALQRLLENAIVYSRPESRVIRLSAATRPGYVGWIIQDEGMGIPADKVAQIVQPFTRVPFNPGGTHGAGLGLTLVQRIAQLHNGFLSIESQEGSGSTIGLWISDAEPDF